MAKKGRTVLTAGEKSLSYFLLLGAVIALSLFGLVMIFSSSHVTALADYDDSFYFLKKQLLWMAIGFAAMLFFAKWDFRKMRRYSAGFSIVACILMGMVWIPGMGISVNGAFRWLSILGVQFQPSELAKFALIIFTADWLTKKREYVNNWKEWFVPVVPIFLLMTFLVALQRDLGTIMILGGILLVMLWVAGTLFRYLTVIVGFSVASVAGLIYFEPFRMDRILAFINPWKDPQNTGYQIIQSLIALGSGHWFGLGLGMSKQKFFYLPAAHTDFIFGIIGEEWGLLGTGLVVLAFAIVAYAGIRISMRATTSFDRLVAAGVTGMIIVQAVLNMGAVTGVLPITGVPLPLVSFGGTSLLFTLAGLGVLLNITGHERKANEGVIDARDYFRGGNRRPPVPRARAG